MKTILTTMSVASLLLLASACTGPSEEQAEQADVADTMEAAVAEESAAEEVSAETADAMASENAEEVMPGAQEDEGDPITAQEDEGDP